MSQQRVRPAQHLGACVGIDCTEVAHLVSVDMRKDLGAEVLLGEARINLQASGIFQAGVCRNFGRAYLKSRSSDSFTSSIKDYAVVDTLAGFDVRAEPQRVREVIGLSGQYAAVDENLTGRENLWMFGMLYQLPSDVARVELGVLEPAVPHAPLGDEDDLLPGDRLGRSAQHRALPAYALLCTPGRAG